MKIIGGVVALVGVVVLVVACVLGFRVLPDYISNRIEEEVSLVPHSETWNKWADIDRPIYLNVYVFNVTNPDEYEAGRYPDLVEAGPYAYRQIRRKRNLTQLNGERSVSYEQQVHYVFDQEASGNNSEADLVNIINVAFISVISGVSRGFGPEFAAGLANGNFTTETIIRRGVAVGDLIFNGFDTSLYTVVLGAYLPAEFDGGRFGIYKGKNGSTDGRYTVHTGVGDSSQFGNVLLWNGNPDLNYWANLSQCDRIKGSDGSIFPPFVEKSRVVEIFSTDLCRSLYLTYEKDMEVHGVKGYRFTVPKEALEDPRTNDQNRCFCLEEDVENCLYSGAIDVSVCRNGAPFVLSTPYFLDGNESYSTVSGLWPSREWHETFIDIEPNTGVLLGASKRIQVNINFKALAGVNAMFLPIEMVFPLMWVDESAEFTATSAQELKDKLLSPKKAVEAWRWVGLAVGIVLILIGTGLYLYGRKRNSREMVLAESEIPTPAPAEATIE